MRIIGLTGGIASGKSTVAKILSELGVTVIDADQISREAVMPGTPAHQAIISEFSEKVLNADGTLNRPALGKIIFADPDARKRLEMITHHAIGRLAEQKLAEQKTAGARVVIYMAPLLIEAGATSRVDEIWVVYVDRETQIARLMQRDGISREEADQRIAAQMPMEEKATYGRIVIDNSGTPDKTEKQIRELWRKETQNGK